MNSDPVQKVYAWKMHSDFCLFHSLDFDFRACLLVKFCLQYFINQNIIKACKFKNTTFSLDKLNNSIKDEEPVLVVQLF